MSTELTDSDSDPALEEEDEDDGELSDESSSDDDTSGVGEVQNEVDDRPTAAFSVAQALSIIRRRKEDQQKAEEEEKKRLEQERKEKAREKKRRRRQNLKLRKAKSREEAKNRTSTYPDESKGEPINDEISGSAPDSKGLKRSSKATSDDESNPASKPRKKRLRSKGNKEILAAKSSPPADTAAKNTNPRSLIPRALLIKRNK